MLEKIEVDLATAGPTETQRLHQRADLIRELLTPRRRSLSRRDLKRGCRLGPPSSQAPGVSTRRRLRPPQWRDAGSLTK
jgi:hypothetical protein